MLLLIALAHAPAFVGDSRIGPAPLNTAAEFVTALLIEDQARNMFAFLFGYGVGQLAQRQHDLGGDWTSIRRLLRRRAFWLIVIGFAHAVLVVPFDFIAVYGLVLLVLAPLVRARNRVLWGTWILSLTLAVRLLVAQVRPVTAPLTAPGTTSTLMEHTYAVHVVARIASWPVPTALSAITVAPVMLLGIWAARRRILDQPERHASLLRHVTVIFLGVSVILRLPAALLAAGEWTTTSNSLRWAVAIVHVLIAYAGGVGLAAASGLVAIKIRRGRLATAMAALGQRSMTFYLFQSLVWLVLFYPFTLDLHDGMSLAATSGIAIALWVASVLLADGMRRAGHRGPAEVLLRRLSYWSPAWASGRDKSQDGLPGEARMPDAGCDRTSTRSTPTRLR
ncbi:DUF418 domain-containing protein [Microbispora sp. NPDC046973]|uniref:DUF418 domain-containing protein n=1 Tax=Microbispora sp. NPDC046973 TaxID=3155022 RepID=UPI0033CC2FD6